MLCRDCDLETRAAGRGRRGDPDSELCSRCGHLLGADDIVRRVIQKQSQLALFGLAGPHRPLLKRAG